jgi:predicted ribonuclease YlaK
LGSKKHLLNNGSSYSDKDIQNALEVFYGIQLDEEQKIFRDCIWDDSRKIVFCNSKAGTGKTTVAVGTANLLCQFKGYENIVYIMSPTQEQKQGFIPGSIEEKSAPYMEPLYDTLLKIGLDPMRVVDSSDNVQGKKDGSAFIQCRTHTYLRGCTFENSVVIIDEMQNYYKSEAKKTLSRISDNCKCICIGHSGQCDLYKNPQNSGFDEAYRVFQYENDNRVAFCTLSVNHRGWISTVADKMDTENKV